jgi:hypothetical protein
VSGPRCSAQNPYMDDVPITVPSFVLEKIFVPQQRLLDHEHGLITTPTATQLKFRLDQRRRWFENEWFFKWHHIGGQRVVEIDTFDGRRARYAGIKFTGSSRDVFWDAITRGARKEVIEQFSWVEERIRGYARAQAEAAIDECAGLLTAFAQSLRNAAVQKDRILRGDGLNFPPQQDNGVWVDVSLGDIAHQAAALKAALFPSKTAVPTGTVPKPSTHGDKPIPAYQVALSFAGEQREYVDAVARALQARGIAVFYDLFEAVTLWGKDGVEFFHQLFAADTAYVVMFISREYVAKKWTRHERRAALSRAIAEEGEYILPVRFDDSIVPGLPDTVQYLRAQDYDPVALVALISEKIGVPALTTKASDVLPPHASSLSGEVTFDYSAFNGRFIIGSGVQRFETMWSKSSDTNIILLNDPPSINGIAVARGATRIADVADASIYDYTSRTRRPQLGEIAILQNIQGFYAAIHILGIKDDTRGADRDEVRIRFAIQPDGSPSFSAYTDDAIT